MTARSCIPFTATLTETGQKHPLLTAPSPTPAGGEVVGGLVNSRNLIEMALGTADFSTMSIQIAG